MIPLLLSLLLTPGTPPPHVRLERQERPAPVQIVVTPDTTIELDGKPCKLADVPKDAEVVELELVEREDGTKVAKKIGFRSRK